MPCLNWQGQGGRAGDTVLARMVAPAEGEIQVL
jgi:hypothetical protein